MSVNIFDGMAGIFVDIFSPIGEETGELETFRFYAPTDGGGLDPIADAPGIFNEQYRETAPLRENANTVVATWPSLVVSIEDYPELLEAQRGWKVKHPDGGPLFEIVTHTDVLRGRMRRYKLKAS